MTLRFKTYFFLPLYTLSIWRRLLTLWNILVLYSDPCLCSADSDPSFVFSLFSHSLKNTKKKKKEIWFLVQAAASEGLICGRNRSSMFLTSDDRSFRAAWKDLKGSISQVVAAIVMLLVRQQESPICSKKAKTTISWLKS